MLKRLSARELLEQVAADWEPVIRAAWIEAIDRIRSNVALKRIVERLERGDVASVVRDLGIEDGAFAKFEQALIQAYHSGGIATVDSMPALRDPSGNRVVFSWGVRNLPAEQAMRDHAARLVTGIVTEARDGIAAILTENLARGQSPYEAGRLIAGRVNRVNGTREGGLIGLSRPQMETMNRILFGMRGGDTETMLRYLGISQRDLQLPDSVLRMKMGKTGLKTRNRIYDMHVVRALRTGGAVPYEPLDRIVRSYSSKALKYRADVISILETHSALARSKRDAYQQQIDDGKLEAQDVTKKWRRTVSREPRMEHLAMASQSAIPFNEKFVLPDGIQCDGPHDPTLPGRHVVGCKCSLDISIDFTGQALRRYRERTGG